MISQWNSSTINRLKLVAKKKNRIYLVFSYGMRTIRLSVCLQKLVYFHMLLLILLFFICSVCMSNWWLLNSPFGVRVHHHTTMLWALEIYFLPRRRNEKKAPTKYIFKLVTKTVQCVQRWRFNAVIIDCVLKLGQIKRICTLEYICYWFTAISSSHVDVWDGDVADKQCHFHKKKMLLSRAAAAAIPISKLTHLKCNHQAIIYWTQCAV